MTAHHFIKGFPTSRLFYFRDDHFNKVKGFCLEFLEGCFGRLHLFLHLRENPLECDWIASNVRMRLDRQ
jgi:hypothetical protein